jgi:hypothetical protein
VNTDARDRHCISSYCIVGDVHWNTDYVRDPAGRDEAGHIFEVLGKEVKSHSEKKYLMHYNEIAFITNPMIAPEQK